MVFVVEVVVVGSGGGDNENGDKHWKIIRWMRDSKINYPKNNDGDECEIDKSNGSVISSGRKVQVLSS